jgi:hypothetical protein
VLFNPNLSVKTWARRFTSFSSNHPTLRMKGLVIKEKVVNFLLEINLQ